MQRVGAVTVIELQATARGVQVHHASVTQSNASADEQRTNIAGVS